MENFTPVSATLGGVLIGLSVAMLFYFNGRILGVSNIAGALLKPHGEGKSWRIIFIAGLLAGGAIIAALSPDNIGESPAQPFTLLIAGLLVGYGAMLGRGCTSGHGICGISRLSPRSIVATLVFMASGMLTVYITRHIAGA